ncbi:DUF2490 domain-containing protein [Vampirovibrio chlorellavorus]|uniref:DUF2490 domain-containing protein n=1 Tax=Vampirovibrio chlorellavorus TaxID=758823 RepID=UPI0026EEB637|nr:DUF2490 domain-containing protein [Vampirovibrio chlorellavorus]
MLNRFLNAFIGSVTLMALWGMASPALASEALRNDLQQWGSVGLTLPLTPGKRVLLMGEAQPRVGNLQDRGTSGDFTQLILRTAVGWQLSQRVSVWQGYAWAPVFEPINVNEHRLHQQVNIQGKIRRLQLTNRTRLEERWIENNDGRVSIRLRHMVRGMYPLDAKERWFLVVSDEAFVTLKGVSNGPAAGFDQNRLFVGVSRKLSPSVNAELGYLNQFNYSRDPVPDRMNHAILLGLNVQVR